MTEGDKVIGLQDMKAQMEDELNRTIESIWAIFPGSYTRADLLSLNVADFFAVVKRAEAEQRRREAQLKKEK